MQKILLKSTGATLLAILLSLTITAVALPLLGGGIDIRAIVMCVACPVLVAFPASFCGFRQSARLRHAHERLANAHAELAEAHARLAERAAHDVMTGMLNRDSFFDMVEIARSERADGTLLLIDADHFKRINDGFGHQAGDVALVEIASAIRRAAPGNAVTGRIGGEEFALFIPAAGPVVAGRVAEAIRRQVEAIQFRPASGALHPLSVSIGGVAADMDDTVPQLLRAADSRLYEAKRRGRNRVEMGVAQQLAA